MTLKEILLASRDAARIRFWLAALGTAAALIYLYFKSVS